MSSKLSASRWACRGCMFIANLLCSALVHQRHLCFYQPVYTICTKKQGNASNYSPYLLWYKQVKVIGFLGAIWPRGEEADISNENVFTVFEPNIDEYKTNRPQHHQQHQHIIHHATAIPGACQFKSKASRSSKDWKDWVIFESFFSWRTCSLGLQSHPCWGATQNWCMYSKATYNEAAAKV